MNRVNPLSFFSGVTGEAMQNITLYARLPVYNPESCLKKCICCHLVDSAAINVNT